MNVAFTWRYATRSLRRSKQRTILAIGCVAIGVMALVALQLVGTMINVGLVSDPRALNGGDIHITEGRATAEQVATLDQLQAQGIITHYTAVATANGVAQSPHPVDPVSLLIIDPATYPLAGEPTFDAPANGTIWSALGGMNIVLTRDLAERMGVQQGDQFTLQLNNGQAFTAHVAGIIANTGRFARPQLLLDAAEFRALRTPQDPPLGYSDLYVDVPGHSAPRMADAQRILREHFPDGDVLTSTMLLASNQQEVDGIRAFLRVVGLVALLIGGMGIINTMQVSLRRRHLEIAMLKALGYQRCHLYGLFGLEAGMIGLSGGLVGALAGIALSIAIKGAFADFLGVPLVATLDLVTVGSGVVLGGVTAVIFGVLPIVQASAVRPIALLRQGAEDARQQRGVGTLLLGAVVALLFYVLAVGILHDPLLGLWLLMGTGLLLGVLTLVFRVVLAIVSRLGIPAALPGAAQVRIALRNMGRQRASTVMTQVAIFVGIFALGIILLLGQGLQAAYAQGSATPNTIFWTLPADFGVVEQQFHQTPAITQQEIFGSASFLPATLDGMDISAALANHEYEEDGLGDRGNLLLGLDLAHGQHLHPTEFAPVAGRPLEAGDAGTTNVVLDAATQRAPLSLKVGDQIGVRFSSKFGGVPEDAPVLTLTVVGFYQPVSPLPSLQSTMLGDRTLVASLAAANPYYMMIAAHVEPQQADATLTQLQTQFGGKLFVHSYVDFFTSVQTFLDAIVRVLEAIVVPTLLAAVLTVANAVGLAMVERRREVGILKAVGYTSRNVLTTVIIEQGVVGLTASLLAMGCATLAALIIGNLGVSTTVGAQALTAAGLIGGSTVVCMLVASLIAWGAARVRPLDVLRYQ